MAHILHPTPTCPTSDGGGTDVYPSVTYIPQYPNDIDYLRQKEREAQRREEHISQQREEQARRDQQQLPPHHPHPIIGHDPTQHPSISGTHTTPPPTTQHPISQHPSTSIAPKKQGFGEGPILEPYTGNQRWCGLCDLSD